MGGKSFLEEVCFLVTFATVIHVSSGAVGIQMLEANPAYPGQCVADDVSGADGRLVLSVKEKFYPAGKCQAVTCGRNGNGGQFYLEYASCGVASIDLDDDNCRVVKDESLPYPRCCEPKIVCQDEETIQLPQGSDDDDGVEVWSGSNAAPATDFLSYDVDLEEASPQVVAKPLPKPKKSKARPPAKKQHTKPQKPRRNFLHRQQQPQQQQQPRPIDYGFPNPWRHFMANDIPHFPYRKQQQQRYNNYYYRQQPPVPPFWWPFYYHHHP